MTTTASVEIGERKRALRHELRSRRALLPAAARAEGSREAARVALRELPWRQQTTVALFWPLADEIDTRPLLHALHWLGARPLLPRMHGKGRPLTFHAWEPELELTHGPFQVREPPADLPAIMPELVLAPLLAFDRGGRRLGYGAGFYDMTFAALTAAGGSPRRVGFCFACQEIDSVPADATDIALDLVITEAGPREIA